MACAIMTFHAAQGKHLQITSLIAMRLVTGRTVHIPAPDETLAGSEQLILRAMHIQLGWFGRTEEIRKEIIIQCITRPEIKG